MALRFSALAHKLGAEAMAKWDDAPPEKFPRTLWTDFLANRDRPGYVNALLGRYRLPLLKFTRHRGLSEIDAEDAVQQVMLRIHDKDLLMKVERERGKKFRSFLLGVVDNVLKENWKKDRAAKRGGHLKGISLDGLQPEPPAKDDPDDVEAFERVIRESDLSEAFRQLDEQCRGGGQLHFAMLDRHVRLCKKTGSPNTYKALGEEFGKSPIEVKSIIRDARERLFPLITKIVEDRCGSRDEFDEEFAPFRWFFKGPKE